MPLSSLEYTVNSLAYDLNNDNNIIIDLSGTGVDDVCNKYSNSKHPIIIHSKAGMTGEWPQEGLRSYTDSGNYIQRARHFSTLLATHYDGTTNACTMSSDQTACSDNEA